MLKENLEDLSCKSKEYYKGITEINVRPRKTRDFSDLLVRKKGDIIIKRKCLFGKKITETAKTDLYRCEGTLVPPEKLARHYYSTCYNPETNEFYWKGKVIIYWGNKNNETEEFENDSDLIDFVNDLKEKCKKCGNELL